jgi:lipopolysaccharide biosynthesis glycosyltransferase
MSAAAIQVALCSDATYAPHLATALQSLFQSNAGAELDVHVLCTDVDPATRDRLQRVARAFDRQLNFHEPDVARFSHLGVRAHFSHAIYLRLLLPELFPDLARLIYLDCDLLVEAPLADLWAIDVDGLACAAKAEDSAYSLARLGLARYVNSGVLLLNLDHWRRNDVARRCIAWLESHQELAELPDQDAINVVLQGQMAFLEERWNLNPAANLRPESIDRHPQRILHFAGPYKPWHRWYDFRLSELYRSYRAATPWGEGFAFKEPESAAQALLVAHQLVRRERFQEAASYFDQAFRLSLGVRKMEGLIQPRVDKIARSLAAQGDFRHACDLHRACFEHWGYPHEYTGILYLYDLAVR